MFNKRLLEYRENGNICDTKMSVSLTDLQKEKKKFNLNIYTGDLERLRRYWMTGTCKPEKEVQKSSDPLALEQFLSVFYLLMVGILFSGMLLVIEKLYIEYTKHKKPKDKEGGSRTLLNLASKIFISSLVEK